MQSMNIVRLIVISIAGIITASCSDKAASDANKTVDAEKRYAAAGICGTEAEANEQFSV